MFSHRLSHVKPVALSNPPNPWASTDVVYLEGAPEVRVSDRDFLERVLRDFRDFRPRQHLHIMVGFIEEQVLEVERLARNVDRQDLPLAVPGHLVTERIAGHEHRAALRAIAFAYAV